MNAHPGAARGSGEEHRCWIRAPLSEILAVPLNHYISLCKLQNRIPYLQNEDSDCACLITF